MAAVLGVHLFLLILGLTCGRSVGAALFLQQHDAPGLALVYVLVGAAVVIVHLGLRWFVRGHDVVRVAQWTGLTAGLGVAAIWSQFITVAEEHQFSFLRGLLYLWVEFFAFLTALQFWTLTNRVFTPDRARRWYVLIGGGGILGSISGGLLVRALAEGGEYVLLLPAALAILPVAGLLELHRRMAGTLKHRSTDRLRLPVPARSAPEARPVEETRLLRRVAVPLACLTLLSVFTTTLCDFYFKQFADQAYAGDAGQLTLLFGNYYLAVGVATLAVQLVGTPLVLRRGSTFAGLMALPLVLGFATLANLLWPLVLTALVLKLGDSTLSHSVNRSCRETLFTYLPAGRRMAYQELCDGLAGRCGILLAGGFLLAFTTLMPGWDATTYLLFLSGCIFTWLLTLSWLRQVCPFATPHHAEPQAASPRIPVEMTPQAA